MKNTPGRRLKVNDTAFVCFSVALTAFAAAGAGLVVNLFFTGWMAVGGMAGVGLFYLAMGIWSVGHHEDSKIEVIGKSEREAVPESVEYPAREEYSSSRRPTKVGAGSE
jgi:hypothetical protein